MKYLYCILVLITMLSCKENENAVENILLNNLKETSKFYETASNEMIMANFAKNDEHSYSNKVTKQFFNNSENANRTLLLIIRKNKKTQINEFNNLLDQINSKSKFKFEKINKSDLENISNETTFYFIKNEFYKNLHQNLLAYNQENFTAPYCGSTIYKEKEK